MSYARGPSEKKPNVPSRGFLGGPKLVHFGQERFDPSISVDAFLIQRRTVSGQAFDMSIAWPDPLNSA